MSRQLVFGIIVILFLLSCGEALPIKGPYQWHKLTLADGVKPEKVSLSKDGEHLYAWAKGHGLFYQTVQKAKEGSSLKKLGVAFHRIDWLSSSWSGLSLGYDKVLMLFDEGNRVWSIDAASAHRNVVGLKNTKFIFSKVLLVNNRWTLAFGQGEPGVIWLKDIDSPEEAPTPFKVKINSIIKNSHFFVAQADNAQDGDLLLAIRLIGKKYSIGHRSSGLLIVPIPTKNTVPGGRAYGRAADQYIAMMAEYNGPWGMDNSNIQCLGSMLHKGEQRYFVGLGPKDKAAMGLASIRGTQIRLDRKRLLFSIENSAKLSLAGESILALEVFRDYSLAVTAQNGLLGINSDGTRAPADDFNLARFDAPSEIIGLDSKVRSIESDGPEDTFLILVEGHGAYLRFR